MRICDYPDDTDFTGFRVRGLASGKVGTVLPQLMSDFGRETYWWVLWDGDDQPSSGWHWNDCEAEVVNESRDKLIDGIILDMRVLSERKWEEQTDCRHKSVMPTFDEEAAKKLSAEEVRERWPRFDGTCPECGRRLILYASYAQYILGDW